MMGLLPLLIASFALGALASQVACRLPLGTVFKGPVITGERAMRTLGRSGVSDIWKERAVRAYALRMLSGTGQICLVVAAIFVPIVLVAGLLELTVLTGLSAFLVSPLGLVAATAGAFLAFRLTARQQEQSTSPYSATDKLLHLLALGSKAIAEMSFDIDQALTRKTRRDITQDQHVFVMGMARAGTTGLMRHIHESNAFRSLTYDDMPFVLAPSLWRRLRGRRSVQQDVMRERAHGDGVMVNSQSPECLDEVFWRVFDGESYITPTALRPHSPKADLQAKFQDYVSAILAGHTGQRYLAKNNNNLLRLPAIKAMFPHAEILLVIRDPLDHAASLWRQHLKFCAQTEEDPFVSEYMGWLVHHEFGADHRPFAPDAADGAAPTTLVYWLRQWIAVHERLIETMPDGLTIVSYEALCDDPAEWETIAARIGVPVGEPSFTRRSHKRPPVTGLEAELERAKLAYDTLLSRQSE